MPASETEPWGFMRARFGPHTTDLTAHSGWSRVCECEGIPGSRGHDGWTLLLIGDSLHLWSETQRGRDVALQCQGEVNGMVAWDSHWSVPKARGCL